MITELLLKLILRSKVIAKTLPSTLFVN